jgi:catechol 2,3-dioxygenase-like lactoylglutathione lyase family enzyme
MELYLVELTVADWRASLAWYRDRLGLRVERLDEANEYALLVAGEGRLALKGGTPLPGTCKLVFRVDDLEATLQTLGAREIYPSRPVKMSAESYRSARFLDLDGYLVEIFEWTIG